VTTKTSTGVTQSWAKEYWSPEARNEFYPKGHKREHGSNILSLTQWNWFRLLASRTERINICCKSTSLWQLVTAVIENKHKFVSFSFQNLEIAFFVHFISQVLIR
jgi:hypothetical protein